MRHSCHCMEAVSVALLLFAAAFALVAAGALLLLFSALKAAWGAKRAGGGAVLVIGPLPLVIGSDERIAKSLVAIAALFTAFVVAAFLLLNWLLR